MGDAWGVWKLRHGSATRMLDAHKRADLERTLERFFSKWAWAWDCLLYTSPSPRDS